MKAKYLHTNIICDDWEKIANFYQEVFGCVPVYTQKKTSKEWLEKCTAIPNACLEGGMLLKLPSDNDNGSILEIFQYSESQEKPEAKGNRKGFGHIAFEVDDIQEARNKMIEHGGGNLGEVASVELGRGRTLQVIYMLDPEQNIVELQQMS